MSVYDRSKLCFGLVLILHLVSGTSLAQEAPASRSYPFAIKPLALLDRVADSGLSRWPLMDGAERDLLEYVWKVKAGGVESSDYRPVEAMLLASGVVDAAQRRRYMGLLGQIVGGAKRATADLGTDVEKGEALMKFLHSGVMKNGYEADQSSLAGVLDTGKYNCVSSTAIYLLAGKEIGLKLTPISIPSESVLPGHASLDIQVGAAKLEVEPTHPDGFDWQAKIKRPGVRVLGHVADRKSSREVDAWGVASMIYSNRGVELGEKEKGEKRLEALTCYVAALALDPANPTAANNLQSIFVNGGPELAERENFDEGLKLLALGRDWAPDNGSMKDNEKVVWSRWISKMLASGEDKRALGVMRRAAERLPDEKDFRSLARWYCELGERRLKESGWEAALEVGDRAGRIIAESDQKELNEWRGGLYRRWSQSLLKDKNIDGSLQVLVRARHAHPRDDEIADGIAFHAQEAMELLEQDASALSKHVARLKASFPDVKEVDEAAMHHARRSVGKLIDRQEFAGSFDWIKQNRGLITDTRECDALRGIVYDAWGRSLAKDGKWPESLDKYAEGIASCPKDGRLKNNLLATIDEWAQTAVEEKKWPEAAQIYQVALKRFPSESHLKSRLEFCEQKKKES